jgi:hypothetical protein
MLQPHDVRQSWGRAAACQSSKQFQKLVCWGACVYHSFWLVFMQSDVQLSLQRLLLSQQLGMLSL